MGTDNSWVAMSNEKENRTNRYPLRNKVNADQSNEKVMSDQESSWGRNTVMTNLLCQE